MYGDGHKSECMNPDLSHSVFSYVDATIESTDTLRYVFSGINRDMLRDGHACRVVAYRAATHSGTCAYFREERPKVREV